MKNKIFILLGGVILSITLLMGCSNSAGNSSNASLETSQVKSIDKSIFTKARINQGTAAYWKVTIKSWEDYGSQIQLETDKGSQVLGLIKIMNINLNTLINCDAKREGCRFIRSNYINNANGFVNQP